MKLKTSELTGIALAWAVAKCENVKLSNAVQTQGQFEYHYSVDNGGDIYSPSTDWAQGGVIIEREGLSVEFTAIPNALWFSNIDGEYERHGATALEAAMRCYVASKLDNEVEIPNELIKEILK